MHRNKKLFYSIISSARASSVSRSPQSASNTTGVLIVTLVK
jgi:hypothetical protein